jgi:hypothetical protein
MSDDELDATTGVTTLAEHYNGVGADTAERLEDIGIETAADILIAEKETLTGVPYVSRTRADAIREAAEDVVGDDYAHNSLADSRAVVLGAALGEKLRITLAERRGWQDPWAVVAVPELVMWESSGGDTWKTRRIRISDKMNGDGGRECDLVVDADGIHIEDAPVEYESAQPDAPGWRVESVGSVGRVEQVAYTQLIGRHQERSNVSGGDDSWRQHYRGGGETA